MVVTSLEQLITLDDGHVVCGNQRVLALSM